MIQKMKPIIILCVLMLFAYSEEGVATKSTNEQQAAERKESEVQNQRLINKIRIDYNSDEYKNSVLVKDGNIFQTAEGILDKVRNHCIAQGWGSNACGYAITQAQSVILSIECKSPPGSPAGLKCADKLASYSWEKKGGKVDDNPFVQPGSAKSSRATKTQTLASVKPKGQPARKAVDPKKK